VCDYYMLVPTKYHRNISFQKKLPSKYIDKNPRSVIHVVWQTFIPMNFKSLSNKKNIKYIHQNLRYYETIVQLLYLSGNHIPLLMICTKLNGHTENIKIYWNKKYHYIEKKVLCWNKFSVFRSDIETVWSTFHEKHFHCLMNMFAPFWHSHNY
jgi:hypothetical protein